MILETPVRSRQGMHPASKAPLEQAASLGTVKHRDYDQASFGICHQSCTIPESLGLLLRQNSWQSGWYGSDTKDRSGSISTLIPHLNACVYVVS